MAFKLSDIDECGHENFGRFGRCVYKYTDCGPWVVAVLPGGKEIYYEDREAYELPMDTVVDHMRVGSIVEGSDVEIGPFRVRDPKDFWSTVSDVNDEADFYWKRDNTQVFEIARPGYTTVYVRNTWGDIEYESGFPFWIRRVHREVLETIMRGFEDEDDEWVVGPYTMRLLDQGGDIY